MGSVLSFLYPSFFAPPAPPPAVPPPPPQIKYDVFLSFRGEDTRYNFITHLHKALDERGIYTFIDYDLNRGDEITLALLTAIEESQISIIIFSKNYASSRWCLEELMKILECKNRGTNEQIVIPVFYGVTPSDLRKQSGSFADAFAMHEKRFKKNLEQVHRWKHALKEAADLSGWPSSADKSEADLIEDIVEDICKKLGSLSSSYASNLVGIDSKIMEIESLFCTGTDYVCSVGIWSIGGIGKTTLAEAVFNKTSHQFKGCSYFARNVRERCEQSDGLNRLQQELLSALLGDKHANINTSVVGSNFIKSRLGRKKLLIVFDDVSTFRQIEGLIGGFDCLGPQSRIIITTRDRQVLKNCGVSQIYEVQKLINHEALKLFCMYAFKRKHPPTDYAEMSKSVLELAKGIPLALKVLGSHLYDKEIKSWRSAIKKMESQPNLEIYEMLKISYDALDGEVQRIFLDIACFFKWIDIEQVKLVLNNCGFHADDGVDVLVDKSLVSICDQSITMHDLLEVTAKEIVRKESIDPSKRSRLWDHEEIYHVLTKNTATETIEGIALDMSKIKENILLNPSDFIKMHSLRILKFYYSSCQGINRVHVSQGFEYNFSALKYLSWDGYCSINSPISSFPLKKLVVLNMRDSKLEQLWKGALPLPNLKEVDLSDSFNLTSCPDLSGSANLTKLNMSWCIDLREISPSIGCLNELESLDLLCCTRLKAIPDFSGLISLRDLSFALCENLNLQNLEFGNLSKLQNLSLVGCKMLKRLPSTICKLISLQALYLGQCSELDQLPKDIGSLSSLKILAAGGTAIRELPSSIIYLNKLEECSFGGLKVQWRNRSNSDRMADGKELFEDDRRFLHYCLSDSLGENWKLSISIDTTDCRVFVDSIIWEIAKCLSELQLKDRALEVLYSLCFQNRRGLFDLENTLKNALHTLQKVKKACIMLQHPKAPIMLLDPESEVPKRFNYRSGNFINVSPNWLNQSQSFMGFALCVVVAPFQKDPLIGCRESDVIKWTCKLKLKDGQSFLMEGNFKEKLMLAFNHVVVKLFPLLPFCPLTLYDAEDISFEIIDNQHYKVEKCCVHLMYDQYIEEVDESCHVDEDENIEEVDESCHVDEDENILSLTNVHHNRQEVEEPHPKRLKETHC